MKIAAEAAHSAASARNLASGTGRIARTAPRVVHAASATHWSDLRVDWAGIHCARTARAEFDLEDYRARFTAQH